MNKQKVLIIDDEKRLLTSLKQLLNVDYNVMTAPDGKEGVKLYENEKPSLILLDLDMPVMNGLEALEKIRSVDRDVLIIIMTGRSSHHLARHCGDLGVDGYIEKPFEITELIHKMNGLLDIGECQVLIDLWGEEYDERFDAAGPLVRTVLNMIWQVEGQGFSRGEAAKKLNISPEHLSRIFHEKCGIPMSEYMNRYRVRKSFPYLIGKKHLKIKEVAAAIGIKDANYFCRFFKKTTGVTPSEFRAQKNPTHKFH